MAAVPTSRVGVAGAGLAALVVIVGVTTAIVFSRANIAAGFGDEVRAFMTTPFFSMTCFLILVAAAIAYRGRPQTHKRLMLLATINLLDAPIVGRHAESRPQRKAHEIKPAGLMRRAAFAAGFEIHQAAPHAPQ